MSQINLFRTVFALCILTASVLSVSVIAQQPSVENAPSPVGRLVAVGGHRLHINCTGKGSPTVVMEAGAGDFSFDWSLVQTKAAKSIRVCTYDRAGYAWSDAGPMPRTMRQIVYELHTGLLKAGINSPYVLVGHSLGGLMVREFANQYPTEVVGMVLVDSSHEDQSIIIVDRNTKKEKVVHWRELAGGKAIPPVQMTMPSPTDSNNSQNVRQTSAQSKVESPFDKLPPDIQKTRLWAMAQPNYDAARSSETFAFLADELTRIYTERRNSKYSLGDRPLIVLTRGIPGTDVQKYEQLAIERKRLQADLVTLSSNSKQVIAKKSGHHIQIDEPALVIDAIKQVVKAVRRKSKLR